MHKKFQNCSGMTQSNEEYHSWIEVISSSSQEDGVGQFEGRSHEKGRLGRMASTSADVPCWDF
jgi:hypothetical protein